MIRINTDLNCVLGALKIWGWKKLKEISLNVAFQPVHQVVVSRNNYAGALVISPSRFWCRESTLKVVNTYLLIAAFFNTRPPASFSGDRVFIFEEKKLQIWYLTKLLY